MNRKKSQSSRRKQDKEKPSATNKRNDVMVDVMEQLRRQRQKRSDAASASNAAKKPSEERTKNSLRDYEQKSPEALMGNFRYDPILKRYLPKSTFKPNGNNDVCIQQMQQASLNMQKSLVKQFTADSSGMFSSAIVTDGEIRRIIFRGGCLKSNVECIAENLDNHCVDSNVSSSDERVHRKIKKRKKQAVKLSTNQNNFNGTEKDPDDPVSETSFNHTYNTKLSCSQKSILLLASSLSYCSASRRKNVASILGPLRVAKGLDIVPTVATKDALQKSRIGCVIASGETSRNNSLSGTAKSCKSQNIQLKESSKMTAPATQQSKWYSMLYPIILSGRTETSHIPIDCQCKAYLPPTISTFDILPVVEDSLPKSSTALPNVVTIAGDRLYYRHSVSVPREGLGAFQLERGRRNKFAQELIPSTLGTLHSVRLAHCPYGNEFVGSTTYDSLADRSYFTLHSVSSSPDLTTSQMYNLLPGCINDFCFGSLKERSVSFAVGGERKGGLHILDLESGTVYEYGSGANHDRVTSEALCVKMQKDGGMNRLISGHRDGSIALIDFRSLDPQLASSSDRDFGSATAILPLEKNEHLILVKGSFGSCRVFDIRRLQSNKRECSKHQQPIVLKLLPPSNVHNTRSANCTGLAVDPTESVVVAPYGTKHNEVIAALWSVDNGQLLRTTKLESSCAPSSPCPMFCELKAFTTSGFRLSCPELGVPTINGDRDFWGIWYKSWSASKSLPLNAGSVQHIIFE